jgi:hypothetical protein
MARGAARTANTILAPAQPFGSQWVGSRRKRGADRSVDHRLQSGAYLLGSFKAVRFLAATFVVEGVVGRGDWVTGGTG